MSQKTADGGTVGGKIGKAKNIATKGAMVAAVAAAGAEVLGSEQLENKRFSDQFGVSAKTYKSWDLLGKKLHY